MTLNGSESMCIWAITGTSNTFIEHQVAPSTSFISPVSLSASNAKPSLPMATPAEKAKRGRMSNILQCFVYMTDT